MSGEPASVRASARPRRRAPALATLSLAERVCLALVDGGVEHGWAIGTELSPGHELGDVWTLSRPLTYRAVDQLADKGLLRRRDARPATGRERTLLTCTAPGRRLAGAWLDEPVAHLRDVRTELLLKLLLRRRRGLALAPLLLAQRHAFADRLDVLRTPADDADLVARWRRESARATQRFLDAALELDAAATGDGEAPAPARPVRALMPLSARNQLRGRVEHVSTGDVLTSVRTRLPDGQAVTAVVTTDALHDLDLAPGDAVLVVVKSTEVMLAVAPDDDA